MRKISIAVISLGITLVIWWWLGPYVRGAVRGEIDTSHRAQIELYVPLALAIAVVLSSVLLICFNRLLGAIKNITGGERPTEQQMTVRERIVEEVVKQANELANDPDRTKKIYDLIFGGVEDVARDVVRTEMDRNPRLNKAGLIMLQAVGTVWLALFVFHTAQDYLVRSLPITLPLTNAERDRHMIPGRIPERATILPGEF